MATQRSWFGRHRDERRNRLSSRKRRLLAERLEQRHLLAGDVLQNPDNPNDVNDDGRVSALDALIVVNWMTRDNLRASVSGESGSIPVRPLYVDVSGDGAVTGKDALRVINAIGTPEGESFTFLEDQGGQIQIEALLQEVNADRLTAIGGFTLDSVLRSERGASLSYNGPNDTGDIEYFPIPNVNGMDYFTFTAETSTGETTDHRVTVNIDPVNDAPMVNSLNVERMTNEDTPLALTAAVVSVDVDTSNITTTVSAGNGTLHVPHTAGVSGNGTNEVSVTGTVQQVNNIYDSLTYTPDTNYNGTDLINLRIIEVNGGNPLEATNSFPVTVNPVNDPPVLDVPHTQHFITNFHNQLDGGIILSDVENTNQWSLNVSFSGDAIINLPNPLTGQVIADGDGTNTVNLSGFGPDVLDAFNGLTYDSSVEGTQTLSITANDQDPVDPQTVTFDLDVPFTQTDFFFTPDSLTLPVGGNIALVSLYLQEVPGYGPQDEFEFALSAFNPDLGTQGGFWGSILLNSAPDITYLDGSPTVPSPNVFVRGTLENLNTALMGTRIFATNDPANVGLTGNRFSTVLNTPDRTTLIRSRQTPVNLIENNGTPPPPINANNDVFTVHEDMSKLLDVLANDHVFPPSVTPMLTQVNGVSTAGTTTFSLDNGTLNLLSDGSLNNNGPQFSYTPNMHFNGTETFTTTVMGSQSPSQVSTVTLHIMPINDPPEAVVDSGGPAVMSTDPVNLDVLANDNPGGGDFESKDRIRITDLSTPNFGNVHVVPGGSGGPDIVQYHLMPGVTSGTDTFTYTITDGRGAMSTTDVFLDIDVPPEGALPVFLDAAEDIPSDFDVITDTGTATVSVSGVNDTPISVDETVPVPGGSVTSNGGLSLTFNPNTDVNGSSIFTYEISNGSSLDPRSETVGTVTATILPVNDPPTATTKSFETDVDAPLTILLSDVLKNDTPGPDNEANQSLFVTSFLPVGSDGAGTVDFSGTTITYTPPDGFSGTQTFTYSIVDSGITKFVADPMTAQNTVTVTVGSANDPPQVNVPGNQTTNEDMPASIPGITVSDTDSSVLTVTLSSNRGTLSVTQSGNLTTFTGNETSSLNVGGTLTDVNDTIGSLLYTPSIDANGDDTLTVSASDVGATITDSFTITVNPVNDPPTVTLGDDVSIGPGSVTIPNFATNILPGPATATDEASQTVSFSTTAFDVTGDLTFDDDPMIDTAGTLTFTTPSNVTGTAQVSVTPIDNGPSASPNNNFGQSQVFTISISSGQNDPPQVNVPGSKTVNEDSDLAIPDLTVTDLDSSELTVSLNVVDGMLTISQSTDLSTFNGSGTSTVNVGGPVTAVNNALNSLTYTPSLNFTGDDHLNVSATDGIGNSTGTVNIEVAPVNDAPLNTVPGGKTLFNTSTLSFTNNELLVSDVDASTLQVSLTIEDSSNNQPSNGILTIGSTTGLQITGNNSSSLTATGSILNLNNALDSLIYDPDDTFVGTDVLTLTTSDLGQTGSGNAMTDTDTVSLSVTPPNVPFAVDDFFDVPEGTAAFVLSPNPLDNDAKDPNSTLDVTGVNPVGSPAGNLAFSNGNFTYTPPSDPDFFGTDTFTYTIEQTPVPTSGNNSADGTVTIEIMPINDGPINSLGDTPIETSPTINGTEDNVLQFSGANALSISDVDALDGDVTVTLTVNNGSLNVTSTGGVTGNNSTQLTIDGTVSQVNNRLNGLTYTPQTNFFGDDTLTINTNDNGNTGGSALFDNDTVDITIAPVNDPPSIVVPGAQSFFTDFDNQFSSDPAPLSISDVDAGNGNVEVNLTIGDGTLTVNNSSGTTITQNPGGNNGITITGTVSNVNNALASGVRYNTSTQGNKTLNVLVNDLGNTGGGELTASESVEVEVLDFVPVDILGKVFIDDDNDAQLGDGEPGIGGIDVTLSGTDFRGQPTQMTTQTDSLGNYTFVSAPLNQSLPFTLTPNGVGRFFIPTIATTHASDTAVTSTFRTGDETSDPITRLPFFNRGKIIAIVNVPITKSADKQFTEIFDLFSRAQETQFQSGIFFGIERGNLQSFTMFFGSGWDQTRYSNARLSLNSDRASGVLTVFDSAAGQDRTANVSTQAGTLTFRGNGVDRIYRVIGGAEILNPLNAT